MQSAKNIKLNGKCISYNNCDDVWLFYLDSLSMKGDDFYEEKVTNCRIVATSVENKEGAPRKELNKRGKKAAGSNKKGGN